MLQLLLIQYDNLKIRYKRLYTDGYLYTKGIRYIAYKKLKVRLKFYNYLINKFNHKGTKLK